MAFEVIVLLRKHDIEYYVAPYEADAQLAYLYQQRLISAVISIDSDLLTFGCERLLTKYRNGWVEEVDLTKLNMNATPLNFNRFTFEMFRTFCILSGCDYLPSIKGIGVKKAHEFAKKYKHFEQIVKAIKRESKYRVPSDYLKRFKLV